MKKIIISFCLIVFILLSPISLAHAISSTDHKNIDFNSFTNKNSKTEQITTQYVANNEVVLVKYSTIQLILPQLMIDRLRYNKNNLFDDQSTNTITLQSLVDKLITFDNVISNTITSNNLLDNIPSLRSEFLIFQNQSTTEDFESLIVLLVLSSLTCFVIIQLSNKKIRSTKIRQSIAYTFVVLLISSSIVVPLSISSNYYGIAYAEEFSFSGIIDDVNNLESNTVTTQPINATSTQPINATSTQPINATSTQPINATSTQPINATSTQPINATSTQTINATSTQPINATSTQPINATSTQPINATSTQPINATSTQPINATSTQPINATSSEISSSNETSDTLLDLNFDTENTNQTSSATLELDGNEDFITIQNNSTDVLSTFTVSGWIKPDYSNGSNEFTILSKENSFVLSVNNNFKPEHIAKFAIFDGIKWTYVESNSTIVEQWTHISTTFDGNHIKIYINGKLEGITELVDTITISANGKLVETQVDAIYSDQDIVIGAYVSTNDGSPQSQNKFSGEIDNISLHDSIFDEQKLTQIYQEQSDYYSSLDVELSLEEILQQIIQENALATNSTDVIPTNSTDVIPISVSQIDLTHDEIEIGKYVTWTQSIELSNKTDNISIELPEDAKITKVTTTEQNDQSIIYDAEQSTHNTVNSDISTGTNGLVDNFDIQKEQIEDTLRIENITEQSISVISIDEISEQVQQGKPTKLLVINDTANQVQLQFETPAPYKTEEDFSTDDKYEKSVTVAHDSTLHYTNVKSFTDLPEDLVKHNVDFKLYWMINETKTDVTADSRFNVEFVDTNNNGIVDQMQWNIPQMSEQEFVVEADINIINTQSYPVVGGTWEVRFTTNGTADLVISAIKQTSFGEALPDDLKFLSIKCGDTEMPYQINGSTITVPNYSCADTGYETSQVLTSGIHNLEFRFGNDVGYANNDAKFVSSIPVNLPLGVATYSNNFIVSSVNDFVANVTSGGSLNWNATGFGLNGPTGVAVNSTGYIYVADTGNDRIVIIAPDGLSSSSFGTLGAGNNNFNTPIGVAIDSSNTVYVVDTGNDRVKVHSKSGSYLSTFTGTTFDGPTGIAVNSAGSIYVADTGNDSIKIFTSSGVYSSEFGTQGAGNNNFNTPIGVAIDSSNTVYVVDTGNDRIKRHSSSGTYMEQFGSSGTGNGNFDGPTGIAVYSNTENIYVSDTGNDKIKKLDDGERVATDTPAITDSATASPTRLATDTPAITDSANTVKTYTISVTDTPAITDSFTLVRSLSVTDTPAITDSFTLVRSLSVTDTPAITDSFTLVRSLSVTDTPAITDSFTLVRSLSVTDTPAITDSFTLVRSLSVTDTPAITDSANTVKTYTISVTDTPAITDSATASPTRLATDTPAITDSANTIKAHSRSVTDTPAITDSFTLVRSLSVTDTPAITDSFTLVRSLSVTDTPAITDSATASPTRLATDTPAITDSANTIKAHSRSVTDTPAITDSFTLVRSLSVTDTPAITDSATASPTRLATDTPAITDSATASPTRLATDTPAITDSANTIKAHSRSVTDTPAITDSFTLVRSLSVTDTPAITDSATASPTRLATDTPAITDSANTIKAHSRSVTDTPAITDSFTLVRSLSVTDTPAITDSANTVKTYTISVTDTPAITDSATASPTRLATDTPAITDSANTIKAHSRSVTDTPAITDSFTLVRSLSVTDTPAITDSANTVKTYTISVTDTPAITDKVNLAGTLLATDTPAITDSANTVKTFIRTATDTPAITDSATAIQAYTRLATDTPAITDSANTVKTFIRTATDTPAITDKVNLAGTLLATDTPAITDSANTVKTFIITATDTPAITDSATAIQAYTRLATDTPAITDSANTVKTFIRTATDTPAITDKVNLAGTLLATDTPAITDSANTVKTFIITATDTPAITDSATASPTRLATDTPNLKSGAYTQKTVTNPTIDNPIIISPTPNVSTIAVTSTNSTIVVPTGGLTSATININATNTDNVFLDSSALATNPTPTTKTVNYSSGWTVNRDADNNSSIEVKTTVFDSTTFSGTNTWDGKIELLSATTATVPTTIVGGTTTTYETPVLTIDLGSSQSLSLSKPIRLEFPSQGNKGLSAFFKQGTAAATIISTVCNGDTLAIIDGINGAGQLKANQECFKDDGSRIYIWTTHLTQFGVARGTPSSSSSGTASSASSSGNGGGDTGVGPAGTTRGFGGILSTPLTINEITYDKCQEYTATILVSSDADKAPSVTVHTSKSGSISATLANTQPYEQSNKITKVDKYLYEIPITSDETFLMVVVTEDKGVSKNTVQAAIHLTSCEGTTMISEVPEEKYEEIATSAPKIFDVKFQIENNTQHSSETESEFYYVDNQDLSVSAIVDAQNLLQRSELRIITIGQSQDYVAIKMDVESLPVSNSTYVISATIPSSLMQEPAITYWIHVIDEDQNEAESKQYNIGVKPISVGDVSFEMDIPSIKESGSLVRPQLFVDNNDLPSYGIVSLVVNGEVISKKSQLFATGETIVNLEWKSPGIDEHTIYDVMASVDLYDKSISTQSAKLHIYPKTITMLASEIKSLEPIKENDTVLADPALIYASNSVDQNLRFHVIAPNGQCIIGVSEECAINDSTTNQRGGLTSIEYEDQIIRVRYSGPDSSLERFSITSIDPLVDNWIVSLETSDGIIPQAQAMKDIPIKVKYRTYSETITVSSE